MGDAGCPQRRHPRQRRKAVQRPEVEVLGRFMKWMARQGQKRKEVRVRDSEAINNL